MSGHYIILCHSVRQSRQVVGHAYKYSVLIPQISVRIIKKNKQNNSIYTAVLQFFKDLFETDNRVCTLAFKLFKFHDFP